MYYIIICNVWAIPTYRFYWLYDDIVATAFVPQTLKAELAQVKIEYEHRQKETKELEECLEAVMLD